MSSSEDRVREIMAVIFEVDPEAIGDGFRRDAAAAWDSMNHLRMISALEEAFGIRFTMREVGEMASFGDVQRKVAERLQAG